MLVSSLPCSHNFSCSFEFLRFFILFLHSADGNRVVRHELHIASEKSPIVAFPWFLLKQTLTTRCRHAAGFDFQVNINMALYRLVVFGLLLLCISQFDNESLEFRFLFGCVDFILFHALYISKYVSYCYLNELSIIIIS